MGVLSRKLLRRVIDRIVRDTILDRTSLMEDAKRKKPWNMTTTERAEAKRLEESKGLMSASAAN